MITKGTQKSTNTTSEVTSVGSTIRQNIVEKLPVINTQVKPYSISIQRNIVFFFN